MTTTTKIVIGVVVALALGFLGGYIYSNSHQQSSTLIAGAATPGGLLAEQYDPYIKINGGYKSALPIQTSADVTTGPTLNVSTSNTATSTVIAGCFQFYATSTATALRFEATTTPGIMRSYYGKCPNL